MSEWLTTWRMAWRLAMPAQSSASASICGIGNASDPLFTSSMPTDAELQSDTPSQKLAPACHARFDKRYLCLVEGEWREPMAAEGWFDAFGWIRPASDALVRKYRVFERAPDMDCWRRDSSAQAAWTRIRPLRVDGGRTLLECVPMTGRTAQIRATLHALGYPVAGDKLYGVDRSLYARLCDDALTDVDRARLAFPRQALHAWKVAFPHPATRQRVEAVAPPPPFLDPGA